ncbi:60S ribosomal export protein NMD3-like [Patiria miniata]|uniref:60S ribosomal export protein NMD3 n=1 Tax=Patiria miniata TaxID=46514 RepID=A0A913ZJX0_PATMI|nr:60S ribosomal export protein NMD3-like [Patiria miniata]
MEYLDENQTSTQGTILCCQCGTPIQPNPANMCVACLRTQVDITEGIPKQAVLYFCKACERYLQPPAQWIKCALESRELLALCLKKLKGLSKVRLVDAGFIWTEPHSRRIKLKLSIQREVMGGAVLEQVFIVEFVVQTQMCPDCHRVEAKDFWKAVVQLRQKTSHKKTFLYLEQYILKHNMHVNTLNIRQHDGGLDFYYTTKDHASKMVDFLMGVVPCKYKTSQQLISHDVHNNTYNYKYTFSVEIVPVCKDNVVCLPKKLARSLGNIGQICICTRVTAAIQVIDPLTLQVAEIPANNYWRSPFNSLCDPKQLTEYTVLQVERIEDRERRHVAGEGSRSNKHLLADVWVMRSQDLGVCDTQYHCRSHLGHLLSAGDLVTGFDFTRTNVNDANLEQMKSDVLPDVVLIKKHYGNHQKRHRRRNWKLKSLRKEEEGVDPDKADRDYIGFLEDLEEDVDYRKNINIYKDRSKEVTVESSDDDDAPRISLQEMLDDLHLTDDEEQLAMQDEAAAIATQ